MVQIWILFIDTCSSCSYETPAYAQSDTFEVAHEFLDHESADAFREKPQMTPGSASKNG